MDITLKPETEKLLRQQMSQGGYQDPDAVVRLALETLNQVEAEPLEELDAETRAAIEEGQAQLDRGEGREWGTVKAELKARFLKA